MPEWDEYTVDDFHFTDFPSGARVLDVGCGDGEQLKALRAAGCIAVGVEPDPAAVDALSRQGLDVHRGVAEALPVEAASFDGLLCKVVLPYCDERRAILEWSRVLKRGARVRACYHGAGYYLRYLVEGGSRGRRVYATRSLVNTWTYAVSGRRLPSWLGDTMYQSRRRLARWYAQAGLQLESERTGKAFANRPVFIYHVLRYAGR
jgi:SAM-dependent methyltransferase